MNDTAQFLTTACLIAADVAFLRFFNPTPVEGLIVAALAFAAIGVNVRIMGEAIKRAGHE
jgi:hypothetical protein